MADWWYWEGGWYGTVPYTAPTTPDWGSWGTVPYNPPVVPDLGSVGTAPSTPAPIVPTNTLGTAPYYPAQVVTNATGTAPNYSPPSENGGGVGTAPGYPSQIPERPGILVMAGSRGWMSLSVSGPPGKRQKLQRSTDLKSWSDLTVISVGLTGKETVFLQTAGPHQFFRVSN